MIDNWATMRPNCPFGVKRVTFMERQMDEQTDEMTEKQRRLSEHVCPPFDSFHDLIVAKEKQSRNAIFAQA